jgi:alpha-1,2-mannosyltransferase
LFLQVDVARCDYMLDLDLPSIEPTVLEPRYAADEETWERVVCRPFLDAARSPMLTRTLWLPGERWKQMNVWGEWCLLRKAGAAGVDARVKAVGAAKKFLEKKSW